MHYKRKPQLRYQAIFQANSRCKMCGKDGSIDGNKGLSFLEIHHIRPLSEGGTDSIENSIVLCPNCHKIEYRNDSYIIFSIIYMY